jgi:HNH endonuclease/AP2 domain
MGIEFTAKLIERFVAKIDLDGPLMSRMDTRCAVWNAATNNHGYGQIRVCGRARYVHRVAYELISGEDPCEMEIDHICGNRRCVRRSHLRSVTHKQNVENHFGARRNSKSGVRGVRWHEQKQRWQARVKHNGTEFHAGYFDTLAEAQSAVVAKRRELFTHNDIDQRMAV